VCTMVAMIVVVCCESVSLLDSLDSTLDNDRRPPAVPLQRTSGDMHTILELTGERTATTATRQPSEEVTLADATGQENTVRNGTAAVNLDRRLSNTQPALMVQNGSDGSGLCSTNVSAKDAAGQTVSGHLQLCILHL